MVREKESQDPLRDWEGAQGQGAETASPALPYLFCPNEIAS